MSAQDNTFKPPPTDMATMTLRDYFAAKALAALIAEPAFSSSSKPMAFVFDDRDEKTDGPERYAYVAYRIADAMLKERAK